ncbi:extracellular matrix protein 2-like isoform X2 [Coregonus clupeaformis]|uniref:extracellular matrix protein 2-like isoform X2 n=1 Tax=Coregonus clupeaformis TaxID=59861 RepID=UPI001BE0ED1B|nr:extracellular matrix protein 2-like isoform X2 [Coregonus clupeaformis]
MAELTMNRLALLYFCLYAAASLIDGKPSRRTEKPRSSKPVVAADSPELDDTDDALLPGGRGQCSVNGMSLFDRAMWSPQPCSVCQCQRGTVSCHPVPCSGSNSQQTVAPKAKKPSPNAEKKEGIPKQKKSLQRTSEEGGAAHQKKEEQHVTPAKAVAVMKSVATQNKKQEVAVKKQEVAVKKQKVAVKIQKVSVKKQEVAVKIKVRKTEVPMAKRRNPTITKDSLPYLPYDDNDNDNHDDHDHSEHDDNDDDDDYIIRATGKPTMRLAPMGRPVTMATGRLATTTTRKPMARAPGPGRAVVTFPRRHSIMESLPAGCLLSESLIACGSTGMVHIPILSDQGVKTLYLADNKISKIPPRALAGLPNLEWLDLSKNKLDDSAISTDLFQNLTKLRRLNLDGNNLTKVPSFLPPSLVELKINDNKILGLTPSSFKGLSKLLTLELEDNHFHDGNVSPLTFRPLKKLIYLRLEDNKFRAIPSGLPVTLQTLHLSDNRIEEVHEGILNKTVNLRFLDLSHNRIREDRIAPRAWIHLLKLESLDLSHNKLVHVPSFLPVGLQQLHLHHNQIERIPGYVFGHIKPGLELLHLSHNRLDNNGIDDVSFLGLYNSLTELLLDHNQLHSIPRGLLKLKILQLLRLNHNVIRYVPLNSLCDTRLSDDSPLVSVHLEYNLIDRRLIPPIALSCIKTYHSIILQPQSHEEDYQHEDY